MKQIYYKHFAPLMPDFYQGKAIIANWRKDDVDWEMNKNMDKNHFNKGFVAEDCLEDPLWNEFADLLPYMSRSASITKLPAGKHMLPHVDRKWRSQALYFPIEGCSELCISEYYNLPKIKTENNMVFDIFPDAQHTYSVYGNAYLTNVHEWHGVRNTSSVERIAVGWDFRTPEMSYQDCKDVLKKLGYLDE